MEKPQADNDKIVCCASLTKRKILAKKIITVTSRMCEDSNLIFVFSGVWGDQELSSATCLGKRRFSSLIKT